MKDEKGPFMLLFCALVVARKNRASLERSVMAVPDDARAKLLANELLSQYPSGQRGQTA